MAKRRRQVKHCVGWPAASWSEYGEPMVASTLPARLLAGSVAFAVGLGAAVAGAQPVPRPVAPPDPVVVLPAPADPVTVDVGVRIGGAGRIGDAPAFSITNRGAFMLGVGVAVAPSPRISIGLAYEHSGLGSEHGAGDLGVVDVDRTTDSLWATLRLSLVRVDGFSLGVTLGPGLVWQSVDATGITYDGATSWQPTPFRCTGTDSVGLGLRAGVGAEVALGSGFVLSVDATADELRLGDDAIGTCAPGAGSTALFGARAGLAYRFDVSRYLR